MGVKLSQEEFNTRVLLANNNIDIIGEYLGDKKDIQFHCGKHDKWFVKKPDTFSGKKALGCSLCSWENGIGGKKYDDFDRKYITKQCNDYEFVEHIDGKNGGSIVYICPKHRDKGCQTVKWDQISSGKAMCRYCYIENMTGNHDEFVNRMNSINNSIKIKSEYKTARIHVRCECLVCGNQWESMPYNLLNGYGCPACSAKRGGEKQRLSRDDKIKKLESFHDDIDFLEIPELAHGYVKCRCKKCGNEWKATYDNLTNSGKQTGCPHCNISKGEQFIETYLINNNIKYVQQKRFDDCRNIKPLPFDFYLPDYNVCIEYDGEHHFMPIQFDGNKDKANERFLYIQNNDKIKTDYCIKNNIKLIRIPYYEKYNIEKILDKIIAC